MATFRTCVQKQRKDGVQIGRAVQQGTPKQRKDGFYPVYIHVTHLKKSMWFVNMNYDI